MSTDKRGKTETLVQGIAASQGIAYGQAFLYLQSDVEVPAYQVEPEKRMQEISRFDHAILVTRQQIQKIMSEVDKNLGPEEAQIFDAHLLVLEDQALISETIREFETSGRNIETCFNKVSQRYIKAFSEIDDEYLRERSGDIRDVAQRVLQNLLGHSSQNLSQLVEKRVVIANDISPSDAAGIDSSQALAIVTDSGSKTSHAVIVARSMKVPAVVAVRDLTKQVMPGDWVLVDGYEGLVILNPTQQTLFRYGQIQIQKKGFEQRLMEANRRPATTLDGVTITLRANIEKVDECALVKEYLADGVGLFRTEFLYLNAGHIPSEEDQFHAYKAVAESLAPSPVVIRTLDLGGDKPMAGHPHLFPKEDNPFLGYRAIRFCLDHPEIFKDQLRAILRASAHGDIRMMYPMISGRDELTRANVMLTECKEELKAKKIPFNAAVQVGAMIEIPSAAITSDVLAKDCDFFSIGTNDLIQYLLAVDRVNNRIAHLYEPTHPAVIRMLKLVVDEAHKNKIKVSVCGEMAGDSVYAPLLLGLGVDELSMTPPLIPAVKYLIRSMKLSDSQKLAEDALKLTSAKEIFTLCNEFSRMRVKLN
ncbi:phosphoenolpyruvate--protein phosphotransferase [Rariglobus hedericola]|uniref:Phosphoenolpyruvate-protein phosphotransferase n=1 Tax=Rariglobus hedericola TaxID=2597822 RepID=A0A556QQ12_9BACT|nr:phosphoenolpyruvate--protein phosphotransferase [Rariglobus hedericola]TSJ78730.1 phosphoenolpyruvate--protein phosphotransferase [Rariglobus hedericola]